MKSSQWGRESPFSGGELNVTCSSLYLTGESQGPLGATHFRVWHVDEEGSWQGQHHHYSLAVDKLGRHNKQKSFYSHSVQPDGLFRTGQDLLLFSSPFQTSNRSSIIITFSSFTLHDPSICFWRTCCATSKELLAHPRELNTQPDRKERLGRKIMQVNNNHHLMTHWINLMGLRFTLGAPTAYGSGMRVCWLADTALLFSVSHEGITKEKEGKMRKEKKTGPRDIDEDGWTWPANADAARNKTWNSRPRCVITVFQLRRVTTHKNREGLWGKKTEKRWWRSIASKKIKKKAEKNKISFIRSSLIFYGTCRGIVGDAFDVPSEENHRYLSSRW